MRDRTPVRSEDLFGQVQVTELDIELWLEHHVPRLSLNAWRRAWYVKAWNVVEKIARAKRAGAWPP